MIRREFIKLTGAAGVAAIGAHWLNDLHQGALASPPPFDMQPNSFAHSSELDHALLTVEVQANLKAEIALGLSSAEAQWTIECPICCCQIAVSANGHKLLG
jgi:hypothetical protein